MLLVLQDRLANCFWLRLCKLCPCISFISWGGYRYLGKREAEAAPAAAADANADAGA